MRDLEAEKEGDIDYVMGHLLQRNNVMTNKDFYEFNVDNIIDAILIDYHDSKSIRCEEKFKLYDNGRKRPKMR